MRLDDESESSNFENRGSGGFSSAGFGGGGGLGLVGMLVPFVFSRFGCGGVAVLLVLFLLFGGGLGSLGSLTGMGPQQAAPSQSSAPAGELSETQRVALRVLGSTERRWGEIFSASGQQYSPPKMIFYQGGGMSGCGAAQAAMGPFYCPADQGIYIDTSFFDELKTRYNVPGDFPLGYVIAHEVGHHIQHLEGTAEKVQAAQARVSKREGNALQVAMELQADCYAGVWAARDRNLLEPGDIEEGLAAAQAIGDDTLQKAAGQRPVPDSFTHGSAAQRQQWLQRGLQSGDPRQCDAFSALGVG